MAGSKGTSCCSDYDEMMKCNSCGVAMSKAAAAASIIAMIFLPVGGRKLDRKTVTKIARKIGPLCPSCLKDCKDLPAK
jgi:hypothetical protein